MRHIQTYSIELKPGHVLVGADKDWHVYFVQQGNAFYEYTIRMLKESYPNFNPSDHDLSKLGTEVK